VSGKRISMSSSHRTLRSKLRKPSSYIPIFNRRLYSGGGGVVSDRKARPLLMEVLSIVCSCVDGRKGSYVYSQWRTLATAHLKYSEDSARTCGSPVSPHMPYTSVHALERSFVHTSVFLHTMSASLCLSSSLFLIQRSTTGIIIPSLIWDRQK